MQEELQRAIGRAVCSAMRGVHSAGGRGRGRPYAGSSTHHWRGPMRTPGSQTPLPSQRQRDQSSPKPRRTWSPPLHALGTTDKGMGWGGFFSVVDDASRKQGDMPAAGDHWAGPPPAGRRPWSQYHHCDRSLISMLVALRGRVCRRPSFGTYSAVAVGALPIASTHANKNAA